MITDAAARVRHLAGRFWESLSQAQPEPGAEADLLALLNPAESSLYRSLSVADRRHAVDCSQAVVELAPEFGGSAMATPEVMVASALHDVGKTPAGLGTLGRVGAAVVGAAMSRGGVAPVFPRVLPARLRRSRAADRLRRQWDHPEVGADMLTAAGSSELAVAWAREHHWSVQQWSFDENLGRLLAAADGECRS